MFSGVVGRGKAAAINTFGTESQRVVASYLYDDTIRIMSSFEMNRFASLTYGEQVCDEMFELFESTLASPDEYSILTLQKTLALIKHVIVHGHERCVSMTWNIGRHVEVLRSYNTAVQSQRNNILVQIKGGEVDRAFVIRQLASELHDLLQSPEGIQILRMQNEDPNSLVPVGHTDEIGFAPTANTAEEWIREQKARQPRVRSNLAKSESGFGGGYTAASGGEKAVVGAAHSIEEMLETAKRNEEKRANRYFDDRGEEERWREKVGQHTVQNLTVSDLLGGAGGGTADSSAAAASDAQRPAQEADTPDLLDLSGFGDESGAGATADGADDLLGLGDVQQPASSTGGGIGMDLLSAGGPSPSIAASPAPGTTADLLGGMDATVGGATDTAAGDGGRQAELEAQLEMQRRQIEMLQMQMKHPGFLNPEEGEGGPGGGDDVSRSIPSNGGTGDDAEPQPSKRAVMNGSSSSAAASAISALENLDINVTSSTSTATPEDDGDGGKGHPPHPPPPDAPPPPPPPAADDGEGTTATVGDGDPSSSLGALSVGLNGTSGEMMPPAPLGAPPPPPPVVSDDVDDGGPSSASVGGDVSSSNPAATTAGDVMGMVLQQQQHMMMQMQQQQQRMMMAAGAGGNPQEIMMNLQRQQQELMMNMMMMQQQMAASGGGNGVTVPTVGTMKDPTVASDPMMTTMMMNSQNGVTAAPAGADHTQIPMGGMAAPGHRMRSIGGGGGLPGSGASNGRE